MAIEEPVLQTASRHAGLINARWLPPAMRRSAASGLVWALIAWFIGHRILGYRIWGGIIIAPLVGILIGHLSRPMRHKPRWVQIAGSLFYLYVAAACFALGTGLSSAVVRPRNMTLSGALIEPVLAVLWGLTFSAYALVLWPLAFFNHRLIWDAGRLPASPQISATSTAVRRLAIGIMGLSALGYAAWALFHIVAAVGSPASGRPWWAATALMGWSTWFVLGDLVWLSAPLLAFGARVAAGSDGRPIATYRELLGLAGFAACAFPILSFASSLLVGTIKISLVHSWATEGTVFWNPQYYLNVFGWTVPWFLVGGGMIVTGWLMRPRR